MIVGAVVMLHILACSLYVSHAGEYGQATAIAGVGPICYLLGVRHAFDADHIAAIDDTTRLLIQQGAQRPMGVGFFFAIGHSSVVVVLALAVTSVAGGAVTGEVSAFASVGVLLSTSVAGLFLAFVAVLNSTLLAQLVQLGRRARVGTITLTELEAALLKGGVLNRLLLGRAQSFLRSSWHMLPVGFLFGLGLETASEVTLLALSAGAAQGSELSILAVLSLPLLFAAGMTAFDTVDGVLMMRAFSWSYGDPRRRLACNIFTTGLTVFVAAFVATVYLAKLGNTLVPIGFLGLYSGLGQHFSLIGPFIVLIFICAWATSVVAANAARRQSGR